MSAKKVLPTKPVVDEAENDDNEDNDEEISLDKQNNERDFDSDEDKEIFSSSNEEEGETNADDNGDGALAVDEDDDAVAQDEDYGGNDNEADGMAADDAEGEEDDDDDDDEAGDDDDDEDAARRLQIQQQRQQPPAKKAKKQEGAAAAAVTKPPRKSTPKIAKSNMTPGQLKQAENKKEWNAMFRDEDQKQQLSTNVWDYIYIAGMQALTEAHNFRKLVIDYKDEHPKVGELADSLATIESYIHKTLKIARSDSDKQMTEIVDFVSGAIAIDIGSVEKANAAACCDITKKKPENGETLICLRAEHPLRDAKAPPGATQFKQKVVHQSLRPLIDATWFFVNLMAATQSMVTTRLMSMKGIKNHETTVAAALENLRTDVTKKALTPTFIRKLRVAQLAINASKTLLALPVVPMTTDDE